MRRRALFISAAVLLLLGATVLAVSRLDLNRYRGQVQATLAERLRRDVSIGEMHVSFVPLGVRLDNSVIGEDPAFQTGRPFARADALYVSVSPLALLRGRIEVRAVELRRPVIELVRNADGGWNVASIGTNRRSGGLVLKQIGVTGGEVAITNLATREKRRTVYQNIDLTLDDYAPDRPFHLVAAMKLPGTGDPRLTLRGEGGPLAGGRIAEAAFKGKLEIDAVVTGTADVALTANEAMLDHVAVALGSTKAQGRLTVRNFASPEIAFELSADTLDVGELQRLLGPARQAPSRQAGVGGDSVLLRTTGTGACVPTPFVTTSSCSRTRRRTCGSIAVSSRCSRLPRPFTAALIEGRSSSTPGGRRRHSPWTTLSIGSMRTGSCHRPPISTTSFRVRSAPRII